ncbi:hypothetical protein LINPERHAP2_LOCUS19876 [Linum perenne]
MAERLKIPIKESLTSLIRNLVDGKPNPSLSQVVSFWRNMPLVRFLHMLCKLLSFLQRPAKLLIVKFKILSGDQRRKKRRCT